MRPAGRLGGALLLLAIAVLAVAAPAPVSVRVKYLSAEHVYVDSGRADGLAVGDALDVMRGGRLVARLEVVHVAEHSASCRRLEDIEAIVVGDLAVRRAGGDASAGADGAVSAAPPIVTASAAEASPDESVAPRARAAASRRTTGVLALRWYYTRATGEIDAWFSEPALRARLSARDFLAPGIDLRLNGTLRHQTRSRAHADLAPASEWRSRVHEVALVHAPEEAGLHWSLGRILPRSVAGVGWVDGAAVEARLGREIWLGGFGGFEPYWRTSEPRSDVRKAGIFARHQLGRPGGQRLASSLALVGLYTNGGISREYLHLAARADLDRRLGLSTSWELDLNRDWRRERTGQAVTLAGAFVGLRWQAARDLDLNLAYDGRRTPWTASNAALPDSLYQDAMRQGLRLRGRLRLNARHQLVYRGGWRRQPAYDRDTWSYGLGWTRLSRTVTVNLDASGYDGALASGWRAALSGRCPWGPGHALRLSGGLQGYRSPGWSGDRKAAWAGGAVDLMVTARTGLGLDYRFEWGDDTGGHRILAEVARRF